MISVPFLDTIKEYKKSWFAGDLMAGLTVGVMLIPQGMAYAMLAGLPPIYGLYASTIPIIAYALFGTSRQLAVGPVAMIALLISSGVGAMAEIGSDQFVSLAILLALMVGLIQLLMGVFRLGFLVNFLSHPVIAGFTSAAAIIIAFSQLKHLLGIKIPRGKVHETIHNVYHQWNEINFPTLAIGLIAIVMLFSLKRISKKIPGPLVAVLLGMGAVYIFGLTEQGVKIVGSVPGGLSGFAMPEINLDVMINLLPIALTISFIGFMESIAVAKAIQAKHKDYEVIPNQELIALGLSNIFGSFFKSFPVTGGFSRTAVNDQAGAKTTLASIISAILIVITLLFFTKYFYYLPNAILAAIIMVAVIGLIDFKEAKHLWKKDKADFWIFLITALCTLILGIEQGILVGVVLSLSLLIFKVSYPHMAELGKVPDSNEFMNIERFDDLQRDKEFLIFRFDARLFFANANSFRDFIFNKIKKRDTIRYVIVECSALNSLDSSAIHMLRDLDDNLQSQGIKLCFSSVRGPVRDILKTNNILVDKNLDRFYLTIWDAIESIKKGTGKDFTDFVMQAD